MLHAMKFVILFMPFKKIASKIGTLQKETPIEEITSSDLEIVWRSIHRAIRFTLYKSVCYDQALAAKIMLKRRGLAATLYFGLAKDERDTMIAHAWVRCGNKIVTGKAGMERFTVVACFS